MQSFTSVFAPCSLHDLTHAQEVCTASVGATAVTGDRMLWDLACLFKLTTNVGYFSGRL